MVPRDITSHRVRNAAVTSDGMQEEAMSDTFTTITVRGVAAALVLAALAVAGPAQAADPVRVYNCMEASEAMNKRWEEKLGIKTALLRLSCGEMWARIQAETKEGTNPGGIGADLVVSVLPDQILIGKKQGLWLPHPQSPGWQGVAPAYVDPDGQAYNLGTFSWLMYASEPRLKEKGHAMPRTMKDLLDPKWKGEILLPSPITSGTAYLIVLSFLSHFGEAEGWKFLEALDQNVAYYTRGGGGPAQLVARGEAMLGLATDEDALPLLGKQAPIRLGAPEEGTGAIGQWIAIPKGSKTPDAAKKMIDLAGTPEFQEFLATYGNLTAREVKSPLYPTRPKLIPIDWAHYGDKETRAKVISTWREKFGHKARTQ
jgi:iron(III) transport system substrate-binding protein